VIGVLARPAVHDAVREFFELFKTPWEFVHSGRTYDAVVSDGSNSVVQYAARIVVLYCGELLPQDCRRATPARRNDHRALTYEDLRLPLSGNCVLFPGAESRLLADAESGQAALHVERRTGETVIRVGYDIFEEVRTLLTVGQPAKYAASPSLDIHIALLRELLLTHKVPLIEVPPVPTGYKFIACLTHDVDHPSILRHKCDHTMLGFLYRAVIRSPIELIRNRSRPRILLRNWWAVCKLPFVYLGLADDVWLCFDRYLELEAGRPSTFFVIPFKGRPGRLGDHSAPTRRAARYDLSDLARPLQRIIDARCELGLHGVDAWHDVSQGREELKRVGQVASERTRGVRMHWLYFDHASPAILERAGADYDSSVGFNETVGYRAGTTQVYKPLDVTQLLELPLHIMDTALFYPVYMNQSAEEAAEHFSYIIANAVRFGGCVTVNWHDRSIAPERCWDGAYVRLIKELEKNGAWFATANQAVSWFRKRRAVAVNRTGVTLTGVVPDAAGEDADTLPGLQCRMYGTAAVGNARSM
jgi:hypothetical protein